MRKLLSNRRGTVAFATVVALVPLIGAVAIGGEAATWYVTKQEAQIAADAAAYSGALKLACQLGASCLDGQTVDYRAKQFAAQNAFCNSGDTAYPGSRCNSLPSGIARSVQIASLSGNRVQATVIQTQPAYLATLLGLTTVNIGATAIAQVTFVANPCVVSLSDPLVLQGSANVNTAGCGLASNNTSSNSIDLTGNGISVSNLGSISGAGGCAETGGTPRCTQTITYAPMVPNPLSGLDTPMGSLRAADFADGKCPSTGSNPPPVAYTATTRCYNDNFTFKNTTYPALNGVYFFSGLTIQSATITGTATFILTPPKFLNSGDTGATLKVTGNPTITLNALSTVSTTQVPIKLQSVVNLMKELLLYDPETTASNKSVTVSGNSGSYFNGIVYAPNATVTYTGSAVSGGCNMLIAKGVQLSGSSTFDISGCPAGTPTSEIHIVRMVQ